MFKTEGEARGFQHFPADIKSVTSGEYSGILPSGGFQHFLADIKSVTSLLVPFLKQYQFLNKNQFKLEYEWGVFRDIAVRRFKEVLKTRAKLPCRY